MQRVPAGTMLIPMVIGALIATVCRGLLGFDLWELLGTPMQDMFSSSGQMLLLGLMLFFTGTQLRLSDLKTAAGRGLRLIAVRLGSAYLLSALDYFAFGYDGVCGISFLTLVCALTSCNAALYLGIVSPMGDRADQASFGVMLVCSMPLLPLLFLGFFGPVGFGRAQVMQIVSQLIPFVLGVVLGNLDRDIRAVFSGGNAIIMPFLGFEFGSAIDLAACLRLLPQGLLLTAVYLVVVIVPSWLYERRRLKRPGYVSVASACVAGVALTIPPLAAKADPSLGVYADTAVSVLAFVLAATDLLCPCLVKLSLKIPRKD